MKDPIAHQLGKHVRALRKRYKLTQEELAGRSHISLKYIQRIESKNPPDLGLERLEKLANGFGMPLWKLVKFE